MEESPSVENPVLLGALSHKPNPTSTSHENSNGEEKSTIQSCQPEDRRDLERSGNGSVFQPITPDNGAPGSPHTLEAEDTGVSAVKRCRTDSVTSADVMSKTVEPTSRAEDRDNESVSSPQIPVVNNEAEDQEGRTLRRSRKKSMLDRPTHLCPVCGVTMRPGEVAGHLSFERERVDRLSRPGKKSGIRGAAQYGGKVQPVSSTTSSGGADGGEDTEQPRVDPKERYENYLRVKTGRQARLCARGRKKKKPSEETTCPVCDKLVSAIPEELNEHVDLCLKQREAEDSIVVDVDGDDEYEEYEWAGQTRIRTSTLLPGGLGASGFPTVTKATAEEEDVDLDVDGDDEDQYGQAQYCEKDIIPCTADEPVENKERVALRKAFLKTELQSVESEPSNRNRWEPNLPKGKSKSGRSRNTPSSSADGPSEDSEMTSLEDQRTITTEEIIESLKVKIKDQERLLGQDRPKCLICMEPHHIPVTSIHCWHVHCEECWLRSLGAKKVCPQCNMITHPTDLRRIYL